MLRKTAKVSGRPLLLPLVYAATLTLVIVSGVALGALGAEHVRTAWVQSTVVADQAVAADWVRSTITRTDLVGVSPDRRAILERSLADLRRRLGYRQVAVSSSDGRVLAADPIGWGAEGPPQRAVVGHATSADIDDRGGLGPSLTETIPISIAGAPGLFVTIQRDAVPIVDAAAAAQRDLLLTTMGAAAVLILLLHVIFRAAGARLRLQTEELVEARRRDPLTGLINHGAAVAKLSEVLARAHEDGAAVGIALIDIDHFRLLNETYGSDAGDEALRVVARALEAEADPWEGLARFGPDEFLAIAPAAVSRELPHAVKRVQATLEATSLQFRDSEQLPLTVSAGVTFFPFHATGMNELLSAATIALGEAKAGGGGQTIIADAWGQEPKPAQSSFDVLQGLVIAIDHKDRYTKRHSEDVACYSLFLATRIGLEEAQRLILGTAGLLHDIGKIGIPDDILRKPGRLTPYEYEIVKQHVALGDLIVRDLAEIDLVRAGVRHHHERWDGTGYLDRLAGEEIPLVARILAVGDAFSAMTTTRPYRKALTVEEALDELRAVAGSQLDPALVDAFVEGIEHDPAAPLPGADRAGGLWTPTIRAA